MLQNRKAVVTSNIATCSQFATALEITLSQLLKGKIEFGSKQDYLLFRISILTIVNSHRLNSTVSSFKIRSRLVI
jgi:hypothetical protein